MGRGINTYHKKPFLRFLYMGGQQVSVAPTRGRKPKMGARQVNIFGTKFSVPKGLRKVPSKNAYAACVGRTMNANGPWTGKSARDIKAAFTSAAASCKGSR